MRKIIFLILTIISISTFVYSDKPIKEITIFIRVDDIFMLESDKKPQEIDHFLKVAEKHNGHVVLATIPNRFLQKTNLNGIMTQQIGDYVKRGHQIFQHGFDHKCPFTGATGFEFFNPKITNGYTQEQRIAKIHEGKQILEAVIGKKVTGYVGPGNDGLYIKQDIPLLSDLGFLWLSDFDTSVPLIINKKGYFTPGIEYTWALKEENYNEMLDQAKKDFSESVKNSNFFVLKFHDHFTRLAYNNGITIKWFDEFLTWIKSLENIKTEIITYDEYYVKLNPDFSADFEIK